MKTARFILAFLLVVSSGITFAQKSKYSSLTTEQICEKYGPKASVLNGWLIEMNPGGKNNEKEFESNTYDVDYTSVILFPDSKELSLLVFGSFFFDDEDEYECDSEIEGFVDFYTDSPYKCRLKDRIKATFKPCIDNSSLTTDTDVVSKICDYIRNKKGYVKFIVPTCDGGPALDFLIPCLNNDPVESDLD